MNFLAFQDELEKISEKEKEAIIDPLSLLGIGAASHIGTNLLVKGLHNTGLLQRMRARNLAQGIRQSLEGSPRGLISRTKELWAGPETVTSELAGRGIGGRLRDMTRGARVKTLKKLRKSVAMSPELQHTPLFEDVVPGVNKVFQEGVPPAKGIAQQSTVLQKFGPYAPIPLLAATEPGALVHLGVNKVRSYLPTTTFGKNFLRRGGKIGLMEGTGSLEKQSPLMTRAMDTLISPAVRDSNKIGNTLGSMATTPEGVYRLKRLEGAFHTMMGNSKARALAQAAREKSGPTGGMLAPLSQSMLETGARAGVENVGARVNRAIGSASSSTVENIRGASTAAQAAVERAAPKIDRFTDSFGQAAAEKIRHGLGRVTIGGKPPIVTPSSGVIT